MPTPLLVVGSTVRDFCMLERNFLSHIKLVLLLLLMFASALLGIRLPGPPGTGQSESLGSFSLPLAILQFIAALLTIAAAYWEYHTGLDDLMKVRAFVVHRVHHIIMAAVTLIIMATCIIYVVNSS
ncbi:hypothetical protein DFJ58DRAFT_694091 [Suillus subalutaceus]|uniref:uncharacterized protein n=1 Tax=Suillus subalutaceus TaxID=48586 RepID=UPI001B8657DF|nr:uncharacterized protein DFJ58DRAFT_694091 [Suillus subalutaceus]KAG1876426.1 hypothetical protein DFJ58DRAFT_694091 [Suillus subalutaceus]KAG1881184.1 hypothetical protein F4604DRAFT_1619514 [Suillus subluteus]